MIRETRKKDDQTHFRLELPVRRMLASVFVPKIGSRSKGSSKASGRSSAIIVHASANSVSLGLALSVSMNHSIHSPYLVLLSKNIDRMGSLPTVPNAKLMPMS